MKGLRLELKSLRLTFIEKKPSLVVMAFSRKFVACFFLGLFLNACLPATGQHFAPFFSESKAIYTLADQRAIRTLKRPVAGGVYDEVVDKTFVAWLGANSNSYVQAFDHAAATWTAPKLVGQVTRSQYFEGADSHNYPLLIQADDGHLLLFYAEHSSELRLARSNEAHSLDFWTDKVISQGFTASYPIPLKTKQGDIYVFFRESSFLIDSDLDLDDRPMQYILSTDNGKTWQSSKAITNEKIALGSWNRSDNLDEIYMSQARYQPRMGLSHERIHLTWTLAGGGPEGPKHDRYHKDVYYAYFRPSNKNFYCAGGKNKGKSIDAREMLDCLVEDTGPLSRETPHAVSYIQLVHYTNRANPIVIYELNDKEGSTRRSATWTGRSWVYSDIPTEGFILDIEKTGSDDFTFYAGRGEILAYTTENAGKTWNFDSSFSLPDNQRVSKLTVIDNYQEPAHFLITEATSQMFPSADVHLVGKAMCLKTGEFQIVSPEGEYLSISAANTFALTDDISKASQWLISDAEGYCTLSTQEGDISLDIQSNLDAKWLIIGAAENQVQLQEMSLGLLKTDLTFGEEEELSYWRLIGENSNR